MVEVRIRVRWADMDAYGHVNNAVYLNYFEEARDQLSVQLFGASAYDIVVARVAIDFRDEITQDDGEVVVRSELVGYGTSSVRTRETVHKPDGTVAAEGECVLVARDQETKRSRPLTEAERRSMDEALT
ncbi:MAG: acyl-CoA thioesterase [Actinomycetes bacterium]